MSIADILLGKPLATADERAEQIGVSAGIPIFGLDALSSAAYGPEAALTLLIPLGAMGVGYILPISFSILVLLAILYFSYRPTIAAVGISAGVGALVSAVPSLQPHTLAFCLSILAIITIVNLRGVREAGGV